MHSSQMTRKRNECFWIVHNRWCRFLIILETFYEIAFYIVWHSTRRSFLRRLWKILSIICHFNVNMYFFRRCRFLFLFLALPLTFLMSVWKTRNTKERSFTKWNIPWEYSWRTLDPWKKKWEKLSLLNGNVLCVVASWTIVVNRRAIYYVECNEWRYWWYLYNFDWSQNNNFFASVSFCLCGTRSSSM